MVGHVVHHTDQSTWISAHVVDRGTDPSLLVWIVGQSGAQPYPEQPLEGLAIGNLRFRKYPRVERLLVGDQKDRGTGSLEEINTPSL